MEGFGLSGRSDRCFRGTAWQRRMPRMSACDFDNHPRLTLEAQLASDQP